MIRAAAWLIIGCLLGAGAVYAVIGESERPGSASFVESFADLSLGRGRPAESDAASVSESLAIYRAVAAEANPAGLRTALAAAATSDWSPSRDVEIDALLARLGELAPAEAAAAARELGLETHFLADAYVYLAVADPGAAIRELAAIDGRSDRLDVALALLDVVGDDSAGLERVSLGLAEADRAQLRVAWIAARAEQDPFGAFREARLLGRNEAGSALQRIGRIWAAQDPSSAVAQADLLAEPLRRQFLAAVLVEWARLDPYAYLSWLESTPSAPAEAAVGLPFLAASHPDLVIGAADGMSGQVGQAARMLALQTFAETDTDEAIARAETMRAGPERDALLMAIGSVLAGRDPDAALAWARNVATPPQRLMTQIMFTIAQTSPERAIEFFDNPPPGVDAQLAMSIATSMMVRESETAEVLADRLVASDSIQSANALRNLVGGWMQQHPERALEWVLAHESQINASVLGTAAQAIASADPAAAAAYLDRIPAEHRSLWINQVAGHYGMSDPNGALTWVAQFQGQAVYDNALRSVIIASAAIDARSAAEALSQASPAVQIGAAPLVAGQFARADPRAAARWAESLADEQARNGAIGMTVSSWAATDFGAARAYTLGLDRGEPRDQALNMLVMTSTQTGDLDTGLLNAFSSDRAVQGALTSVIPIIARQDPDEARALLDRVTSGEARRVIEAQIEAQIEGQARAPFGSAGGIRLFEGN